MLVYQRLTYVLFWEVLREILIFDWKNLPMATTRKLDAGWCGLEGSAGSSDPSSLGVTRAKYPVQASRTNQLASVTATAFCKPANQPNIVRQGTKGCTVWLRCGSIAENSSNICNMQQSCLGSEGIQIENTIESHTHLRLHLRLIKFYHVLHVDICHNPNFKHTLGLSRVRPIETFSILESNVFSWFRVNGTCVCTILHIYRIFMNIGILNFETKNIFHYRSPWESKHEFTFVRTSGEAKRFEGLETPPWQGEFCLAFDKTPRIPSLAHPRWSRIIIYV